MLPFPQVFCPMEEDVSTPCAPLCTPLHSESHRHVQSPSFVKSSHNSEDEEQKKSVRRSGRLQIVKEQAQERRQENRKSTQRRGRLASSHATEKIAGGTKRCSRRNAQCGTIMHKGKRSSACTVNQVTTILRTEDCAARKSVGDLEANQPEKDLDISEPSESQPPAKQWVIGPLLQSFKTKMACFTEIVMSPIRLFKPSNSLPSSPDGSNLRLDSVQEGYMNSDTNNGCLPEEKKERDNTGIENKGEDGKIAFTSQEINAPSLVKRESDTDALNFCLCELNQGTGTSIEGAQKCFCKSSSVQRLNFETDIEVQIPSKEQGSIIVKEQNVGFYASPQADEQQGCQIYHQVLSRSDKKQETESHVCLEHSSLLSPSFKMGSVPCDSHSVPSPQDSHKDGQKSNSPFSSDGKQFHVLLKRLGCKRASPNVDVPHDCPGKRSVTCVSDSTTKPTDSPFFSEEKPDFCNVEEQGLGHISEPPIRETGASAGSDSLTSLLYYTPPNTLSTSDETETNLCQLRNLEKDVDECPSVSSVSCNIGEDDMKGCTNSEISLSKSSVTAAKVCDGVSVQDLVDHEEMFGECCQIHLQRAGWPEPCFLQKEHTANAPDEEEDEIKTTEKRPGIQTEEDNQKLKGAGKHLRGRTVLNKRRKNIAEEVLIASTRETRRCKRPYQVTRGTGPDECKNSKGHDTGTSQDTDKEFSAVGSSSGDRNCGSNRMVDAGSLENTNVRRTKTNRKPLSNNADPHINKSTIAFFLKEPVVMISKFSPEYLVSVAQNSVEAMHKDEEKMERTITPGTLSKEVGHHGPRKEGQRCRRQNRNVNRDTEVDSSTNVNTEMTVQDKVEGSPQRYSLQNVTKESKGKCLRVPVARKCEWRVGRQKTKNCSTVTKSKHIGQQKEEETWQTEKFIQVGLTEDRAQLDGSKKNCNEISGQVELEMHDISLHQKWTAQTRDAGKAVPEHDDNQRLSDSLETVKMSTRNFTNSAGFASSPTLKSSLPYVTTGSPGVFGSADGSTASIGFELSGCQAEAVPLQMLDRERHPVCSAEYATKQNGCQEECFCEKPEQEVKESVFSSPSASAAMQKFGGRKIADTELGEEAESGKICKPAHSDLVTKLGGWKAKHTKVPHKSHPYRRARSCLRTEGSGKDNKDETEGHTKDATPQKTSGNSSLPTRLLRSYSCPEISTLSENSCSVPSLLSTLHSKLPPPLQKCPLVHTPHSGARRTRRHTVCSVEVEREIAPLCLRKEVYPTGRRCCSPASICSTSPSYSSLTPLASLFLSSPLAFLSQSNTGTSGSSSMNCDFAPSSCGVPTPSSTSPGASSTHNLFPGSSGGISPRSGQCSTSVSSVCSKSTEVPLEHKGGTRHRQQQNESCSFRLELAARESREEKALSDSEIKMETTKQEEYGKVSRIRIRKTLPKPLNNLTPMGLPKPVRLKKKEFSLEEIYTNKNFRKPPEGRLETIFEVPVSGRDGSLSLISQRRFKRLVEFPEAGVARKPKRPLVGLGMCRKSREISAVGRTRRGGNAQGKEGCSLTSQELDSLLCSKLNQLDSWISLDKVGVLA